ncbi:GNAT family N-acetyltransferase [Thalassovita sp.]|uniref:GNAT family N-acetyltransferase n=1 Tax=Thalassovita sp. TaxID=1979401 RepID=UPI002AB16011|nr:GNAT family N-acetyltransferase [Thalassovita sp.]
MYKIRPASMRDVEGIAQIHVNCWTECYPYLPKGLHKLRGVEHRRMHWRKRIADHNDGIVLALEIDGEVKGFSYTMRNNDPDMPLAEAELHACYFLPEARRSSAGPQMMIEMIDHAHKFGWESICVWAWVKNPVRRTYAALGLEPLVHRERVIGKFSAKEVGYLCLDLGKLSEKLEANAILIERRGGASRSLQFRPARLRPIEIRNGIDR